MDIINSATNSKHDECVLFYSFTLKAKICRRYATRYAPAPLLPHGHPAPHAPLIRCNIAVVSHAQYVLTVTAAPASCDKAALSKGAW